jgi:hypothetical protein
MPSKVQLIGGAFQDSEGNLLANGYLDMFLSQDCSVTGVGNICSGISVRIQLDSNANVASSTSTPPAANQYVWGNDVLLPTNNFYRVTGYTANGQPAWGPNNQQVIGTGTFDVGQWVPNQIYSWTPPLTTVELEVNGTPTSDQAVLNLTAGSNITITDEGDGEIIIAASGGGSPNPLGAAMIPVPADGFQLSPTGLSSGLPLGLVVAFKFRLLAATTFTKLAWSSSSGYADSVYAFAIYSEDGSTKLIDSGPLTGRNNTYGKSIPGGPVTLQEGTYWMATGENAGGTTGATEMGFFPAIGVSFGSGGIGDVMNFESIKLGASSNSITTSGVMPTTLGTISGNNSVRGFGTVVFE